MPHIEDSQPTPQEDLSTSSERTHQVRIKNRRKLYLDSHPSYFASPDLELAGIPHVPSYLTLKTKNNEFQILYFTTAVSGAFKPPLSAKLMGKQKAIPAS
jgi:hypothetical protein